MRIVLLILVSIFSILGGIACGKRSATIGTFPRRVADTGEAKPVVPTKPSEPSTPAVNPVTTAIAPFLPTWDLNEGEDPEPGALGCTLTTSTLPVHPDSSQTVDFALTLRGDVFVATIFGVPVATKSRTLTVPAANVFVGGGSGLLKQALTVTVQGKDQSTATCSAEVTGAWLTQALEFVSLKSAYYRNDPAHPQAGEPGWRATLVKVANLFEGESIEKVEVAAISADFRVVGCSAFGSRVEQGEGLFQETWRCTVAYKAHPTAHLQYDGERYVVTARIKNGDGEVSQSLPAYDVTTCIIPPTQDTASPCEARAGRVVVGPIEVNKTAADFPPGVGTFPAEFPSQQELEKQFSELNK